jgi:uncharacterized membrane protein YvbJ
MVYCPSCGTKNEDTAKHCVQCGESLFFGDKPRPAQRSSDLCYEWEDDKSQKKISQRGILIIGAIIVVIALSQIADIWFPEIESSIWPAFFLAAGIIVVLYALFFFRRDS